MRSTQDRICTGQLSTWIHVLQEEILSFKQDFSKVKLGCRHGLMSVCQRRNVLQMFKTEEMQR